jgi:hypothetical protein
MFKDVVGNWSLVYSDTTTVVIDTTPPTMGIAKDGGQYTLRADQLAASWSASDPESGIAEYQYRITQDAPEGTIIKDWTSRGTSVSVTAIGLSLIEGKTYYFSVKAKNKTGLWSSIAYSDGITVDITPPTGSILINNDALYTTTTAVTLNLSAQDAISGMGGTGAQMKFSNDNITWSAAVAYVTTKARTLISGSGIKTVYVKFKDVAGNWSGVYSDTIELR